MYVAAVCLIVAAVAFARLVAINGAKRLGPSAMALLCVVLIPFAANVILVIVPSYGYPTPLMLGGFMASFLLLPLLVQLLLDSPDRGKARLHVPAKGDVRRLLLPYCRRAWSYVLQSNADAEVAGMPEPNCFFGHPNCQRARRKPRCASGREGIDRRQARSGQLSEHQRFLCSRKQLCEVGHVWDNHYQNNMRSWDVIMKQFAGQSFNYCSFDECAKVIRSSEFANMLLYPANDSVATIDGVVVVKISDISKYSE